jgi:quercetin dioxygenase-like cupin family protein
MWSRFAAMVATNILTLVLCVDGAVAQQSGAPVAKPLLRAPVSGDAAREALMISAEFPPGATTGRHTHPGDEYTAVLAGTLELRLEGQAPRRVSAGESYHNPRGLVHETVNVGEGPARIMITLIVEKGQPPVQLAK